LRRTSTSCGHACRQTQYMVFSEECKEIIAAPSPEPPTRIVILYPYFFLALSSRRFLSTACAAASRAMGTLYGEQET